MLQGAVRQLRRAPIFICLFLVSLWVLACGGPLVPASPELAATSTEAAVSAVQPDSPPHPTSGERGHLDAATGLGADLGEDIRFEHLSLEQGLSQSVVLSIVQDPQGFMWFATQDGLNRYDGYDLRVHKHVPGNPDSPSDNYIWSLHADRSGKLWIGTGAGGLDRLDLETGRFTHFRHNPDDPNSLGSNAVLTIYEDRDGTLWIGTDSGGIHQFDPETERFTRYQNEPDDPDSLSDNTVQAIFQDREGKLWIGTDSGGLNRLDLETGQFTRYQNDPQDGQSLSSDNVLAIYEDRKGVLWIGTYGGGLERFDRDTERFTHHRNDPSDAHSLSHDTVQVIYEDREGMLWIGTNGGGLERFDRETGQFIHTRNDPSDPHSLSSDQVWSIYEDQAGVLWFGTFGGGVDRFDRGRRKFVHYQSKADDPNSLSDNVVWAIYENPEGVLWLGTFSGGLNKLDRETGEFIHYRHVPTDTYSLSDDAVWSIYQDRGGDFWVGTSAGLDQFDGESGQFTNHPSLPIFTIYEDSNGVLWVGTWGGGLGRFDRDTGQFTFYQNDPADPHSLADDSVLAIREDPSGGLWVGTFSGGLNRLDRETERFFRYQNDPEDPNSLGHNLVLSIFPDQEGGLWLGTGGGLDRFDLETETFMHYTEKDGLASNVVYGILEEDPPPNDGERHLWLSTNRGLSRFNRSAETFRNYGVGDGLQSNEFNQGAYYKSASGEMFFGGVNGFNAFFPERVQDNAYVPPVVLTALTQGGEPLDTATAVESLAEITFSWPRNFFGFEFAALSYSAPENNEYAYQLEGFDLDWIETGTRRFGRYTNLPGGTYVLRIKGSNNDGVWNETGHSLAVTVVPPFWQTWWFRGGVALILLVGVIAGYRLRVRSVEARSHELEGQVAHRTRELGALNAVAAVVNRSLDLQGILQDALDKTLQVTETEGGGVYLLDREEGMLTLVAHRGFGRDLVVDIDRLQVGEGFSGRVVQSGEPLVVADIGTDPRLTRMSAREEGFHALASVPLSSKGKVLGTLFAMTRGYRAFSDEDVDLLTSIGHQIGVAVENARLFESEKRRAEQFRLISEVGRHTIDILDVGQLLDEIVQRVNEILGYYLVGIGLIEGDEIVVKTGVGPYWESPGHEPIRFKVGQQWIVGWVAASGEPLLAPDVSQEPRYYHLPEIPDTRSELAVPMRTKERVIGVLDVQSRRLDAFNESDVVALQALANQAAVAIEKARLLEAERQRADELDALRTTMADITAELELPALLQAVVERAAGLLDATGGELGLYDEASQELRIVVSYNLGKDYVGARQGLGEGAMGRVAETGESLIIQDYQTWDGALNSYSHVRATLAAPLKVGGRLVGVFTTVSTDPDRRFTATDLHLLNLFTQQAAIAIENARLYEQAQQLAAMEERQRLARDLHDSVTQALYGMTLYSEAAARQLSLGHADRTAEHLDELQEMAREALAEMRLLIYELRPPMLEEEGLEAALQARLLAVEERAGLKTSLSAELKGRLPPAFEEGLYRIAQEALNNALKHAKARHIAVRLEGTERNVALEIRDDGTGFDPVTARAGGGMGLAVMEERAANLGARLTIEGQAGEGTRVLVEVFV